MTSEDNVGKLLASLTLEEKVTISYSQAELESLGSILGRIETNLHCRSLSSQAQHFPTQHLSRQKEFHS